MPESYDLLRNYYEIVWFRSSLPISGSWDVYTIGVYPDLENLLSE
jgi:hypothetical protein